MSELLEISKKYKREADALLAETGLVEDLEKYGKVHFTGAYAGDVMMHGDVDITVVRAEPFTAEEVFDILRELYFKGKFRSYFIGGDWDDPRKGKEFPHGYYIGLKEKKEKEKWKCDIWFVSEKDFADRQGLFNIGSVTLTPEQREKILAFKKYRNDNKLSITGQKIYEAVLEGKCETTDDLLQYGASS